MIPPGMFSTGRKDPYFANVKLLLQGSGSSIVDKSRNAFSLSIQGNTALSSTFVKNNPKSIYFDGTGDYITADGAWPDQGTGDWTVEFWINSTTPAMSTNAQTILDFTTSGANLVFTLPSTGKLIISINSNQYQMSTVMSANTWYHIAVCRIGTNHYIFINGSLVSTYTSSWTWATSTKVTLATSVSKRATTSGGHFLGYIDELRLTSGIGRYSATFTLPTKPLPTR